MCQNWSSLLYNLVSNLLLLTIYVIVWIKSASDIYVISSLTKTLFFFTNYFMVLPLFHLVSRSFYTIPYMDSQPWEAILAWGKFYCGPTG